MSAELLSLPDIAETWDGIMHKRDLLKITLPDLKSVGKTPGKIFAHAEAMVEIVPRLSAVMVNVAPVLSIVSKRIWT